MKRVDRVVECRHGPVSVNRCKVEFAVVVSSDEMGKHGVAEHQVDTGQGMLEHVTIASPRSNRHAERARDRGPIGQDD